MSDLNWRGFDAERCSPSSKSPAWIALLALTAACSAATDPETSRDAPKPDGARSDALTNNWDVQDKFGRSFASPVQTITLADWEGHVANPIVGLKIIAPSSLAGSVTTTISVRKSNGSAAPLLYFDRDTTTAFGASGPTHVQQFTASQSRLLYIGNWPDHNSSDETYTLSISAPGVIAANIPIVVKDFDPPSWSTVFAINVDYSQDAPTTGGLDFYNATTAADKRAVVNQVAQDWAYFFDLKAGTARLDQVTAAAERTLRLRSNWNYSAYPNSPWSYVNNANAYNGFLLYAYGVEGPGSQLTGTGHPAEDCSNLNIRCQTRGGGTQVPGKLARSGGMLLDRRGNFSTAGWYVSNNDEDWYQKGNFANEAHDLSSIAHHELGHALLFHSKYQNWSSYESVQSVTDTDVRNYYHAVYPTQEVPVYATDDHLVDPANPYGSSALHALDPASQFGAFGNEYASNGFMPARRWITTKLDLLIADALGYTRRAPRTDPTGGWPVGGPFVPLTVVNPPASGSTSLLPAAKVNTAYSPQPLIATSSLPTYRWSTIGAPAWLSVGSFTGVLSGTPTGVGVASFTVKAESAGYVAESDTQATQIRVCGASATPAGPYCWHLGAAGQSCSTACGSFGGYDAATASVVGTTAQGGSIFFCAVLLNALTGTAGTPTAIGATSGLGCMLYQGSTRLWASSPNLTSTASHPTVQRVCACAQ
jgi:putative Ig domain-containing protein